MVERSPTEIVIDDLERIKEDTWSSFDSGCLAGAVDLIRELTTERNALIERLSAPLGELAVADWLIGELNSDVIKQDARISELTELLHQQEAAFDADTKTAVDLIGEHGKALEAIRDALADMCPAWALEWPTVRAAMFPGEPFVEDFTAQDVRDSVAPCFDAIAVALRTVGL